MGPGPDLILLKPADTAETLGLSANSVRVLVRRGLLTQVHFGRAVRYRSDEIRRLIEQGGYR